MPSDAIGRAEGLIRRIGFPLVGVAGLIWEEMSPPVDPMLVAAYLALMGFGGLGWLRDAYVKKGGGE